MNYADTLADCLKNYPIVFGDEYDVLEHLFFVNGNGYEWNDGCLIDPYPEPSLVAQLGLEFVADAREVPHRIYRICKYAKILSLPDDIQPDWLAAAERAIDWAEGPECLLTDDDRHHLAIARQRIAALKGI